MRHTGGLYHLRLYDDVALPSLRIMFVNFTTLIEMSNNGL